MPIPQLGEELGEEEEKKTLASVRFWFSVWPFAYGL